MAQFSDTSNLTGLVEHTDWLLSTNSTSYPLKDKTRSCNFWYDRVASLIMKADNNWEWDDNNQTDLPIATCSLVANQQDYTISGATFLKILKVEIKDESGNWRSLNPISLNDKRSESMTDYQKTAGNPTEYDKIGNSIFLYPKPSYSQATSLKVFYQRNVSHFVYTDTTKVPGFAENFHLILSLGMAYDYCVAFNIQSRIPYFRDEIAKLENDITSFYSNRARDSKIRMSVITDDDRPVYYDDRIIY